MDWEMREPEEEEESRRVQLAREEAVEAELEVEVGLEEVEAFEQSREREARQM